MKLDLLVFAAHPDDAEMSCGGTICKLIAQGKKVGVIDLTRGELGTRGSAEIRDQEAANASKIMGIHVRENLRFRDGFFNYDEAHQIAIIQRIRKYCPDLVITNSPDDRHPDHGKAAKLVRDAAFLSGLRKISTSYEGEMQLEWRPKKLFYFIQDTWHMPDFVVDVSEFQEQKMEAVRAFKSQFYNPESDEPGSYISSQEFMEFLIGRARDVGHMVEATFGEGFLSERPIKITNPLDLL